MADVITRLLVDSKDYDNKILRASKSLAEMTHQAEINGNKIATANQKNIALAQSLGKMQTVATSVRGKMNELSTAFENATHSYNKLTQAEKNSPFGRALKTSVDQLQVRIRNLRTEMQTTQAQLGKTGGMSMGSMGGIGAQLKMGMGSAAAALGPAALAAAGVTAAIQGMKNVVGDMVRINMEFEQGSANLAAVLGTSRSEITALTEQAKQLGATTQYTANQILELQANLARLGFNQNEILNSTKSVQAMATAMGADLGDAANLAGSALRGFGLNATEMERVASVLSVATTKSALSFEKLATALPVVQTTASKTGFTIEDTVAMLGKLTDNGINAASAATQLRKILNDSTTAGTKLANALGGPVKNFEELVAALNKASKAGQNHADSVALVNSKNATALDILRDMSVQREVEINGVKKQTSSLQELRDSITDCADGMKAMQDEQLNTLQGSITSLNSAWEGLMLTFAESNGTIKKVTDRLTRLLTAYTNWRKRNQGGDTAVSTYEQGGDKDAAKKYIEEGRAGGQSDDEIVAAATARKAALEKEAKEIQKAEGLYKAYEQALKNAAMTGQSGNQKMINAAYDKVEEAKKALAAVGYDVNKGGVGLNKIYQDAAAKKDQAATMDLVTAQLAPATQTVDTNEEEKEEEKSKKQLAILKARYEEQEKAQIAALDRMAMNETDYEAQVYKIKRETLQKIADLYQEETAEKARANAAISQLDIQYQGTQMRLANKSTKAESKNRIETGPSGYSEEGIGALRKQMQGSMKSMQMGSSEYLVQAQNLVDLKTFENLLKVATQNGIQLDPAMLEEMFENIDDAAFNLTPAVSDEAWAELVATINDQLKDLGIDPINLDVNTGEISSKPLDMAKATKAGWEAAANAIGQVGGALQQIEDPTAKIAGIIAQAVANIALSFAEAAASPAVTSTGWGWLGFAAAGLSTMIATIASIRQVTAGSYAQGGIIPGNNHSDGLIANVSSGELILNRAQQDSVASQLQSNNPIGNMRLYTDVSGTDLRFVLDSDNRSQGGSRGEYSRIR